MHINLSTQVIFHSRRQQAECLRDHERGGRQHMLAVLLRAAVSVRLHPFPALPSKGLLANILFTSHFSLLPFLEVRLLGLPPLQHPSPLFIHSIFVPQRSHTPERCLWNHHMGVSGVTPVLHILPIPCTKPTQSMCSVVPLRACGRLSKLHCDAHCSQIFSQQLEGLQLCGGPREKHCPEDKEKWGTAFGLLKCVGYWLMLL